MTSDPSVRASFGGDIYDLKAGLVITWRRKKLVGALVFATTVVAAIAAFAMPPKFTSTATLLPATGESLPPTVPSSLASLASLAGIETIGDSTGQEAMLTLRSRRFLYSFIESHAVRQELYPQLWDAERGRWREHNPGIMERLLDWIASIRSPDKLTSSGDGGPTLWQTYERFQNLLDVSQDRQTRVIRVSIEWRNPIVAAMWVNQLVADLDQQMRRTAIDQSTNRLEFLRKKLTEENFVSLRESISSLIEKELTRIMVATVQDEFSLRVIDPGVIPERKSRPRRTAIVFIGAMAGLLAGIVASHWVEHRGAASRRS